MTYRRFIVVINAAAGDQKNEQLLDCISQQIPAESLLKTHQLHPGPDFEHEIDRAIHDAAAEEAVLLIAGGDGTVNTFLGRTSVLNATVGKSTLAIIPRGTFNYFARDHGIPTETKAAIRNAIEGEATAVPLCWVNREPFCVSASLGVYPKIMKARERMLAKTGRSRLAAVLTSIWVFLTSQKRSLISIEHGTQVRQMRTPLVVVTCSQTQIQTFDMPEASHLDQGYMILFAMRGRTSISMLFALLRSAFGGIRNVEEISYEPVQKLKITYSRVRRRKSIEVAVDGEIRKLQNPLIFTVEHEAAQVIMPAKKQDGE
ncbi:diacylglycerol/lipid kinase family protein [Allohahella marinimesophila]|uniref:Diacylglycerol kinase family protein n=1 Tax=Allohahella marinimesophila TaxID=1054972 RepID=A0ABP7Q3U3_9GAMM